VTYKFLHGSTPWYSYIDRVADLAGRPYTGSMFCKHQSSGRTDFLSCLHLGAAPRAFWSSDLERVPAWRRCFDAVAIPWRWLNTLLFQKSQMMLVLYTCIHKLHVHKVWLTLNYCSTCVQNVGKRMIICLSLTKPKCTFIKYTRRLRVLNAANVVINCSFSDRNSVFYAFSIKIKH